MQVTQASNPMYEAPTDEEVGMGNRAVEPDSEAGEGESQ